MLCCEVFQGCPAQSHPACLLGRPRKDAQLVVVESVGFALEAKLSARRAVPVDPPFEQGCTVWAVP